MRTNYKKTVTAVGGVVTDQQMQRIANLGSFVTVRGGSLWNSGQG